MPEFKVGDRVTSNWDGISGTVEMVKGDQVSVIWDDANGAHLLGSNEVTKTGKQLGISSFEQSVRYHTNKIADLLIAKNKAYGDSALNPIRVFSKADRMEQLYIRLDDKLSRVQKGHEYPGDDTVQDIIGYCLLILIARESA